jgi:phosphatidylserine/phosphatidylglycerophosphate/cardiolipin synthase-like enzyme
VTFDGHAGSYAGETGANGRVSVATPKVGAYFLRDTRDGGPARQPQTTANRLAAFIENAASTLEVAIYDFRLMNTQLAATVVGALTGAAKRGVTVRLAYDAGKPITGAATIFARLAADPAPPGTAQWVANNFGNSDVQIHAITAPSGQLMHSKFVVRDGTKAASSSAIWTGSANWTDDAWTLQENNIITVSSPVVAAAYLIDFEQLWATGSIKATGGNDVGTATVGRATVGANFAPGGGAAIDARLAAAVTGATNRVVIATMVLTSRTLLDALAAAINRGVPVIGIYDSGQMSPIEKEWAKSRSAASAAALAAWTTIKPNLVAKRSTPYEPTSPHDFMHNKILIADEELFTGSYNFSANAEKNAENQLNIQADATLIEHYLDFIAAITAAYQ